MPAFNRQSAPDLAPIALLTIFASAAILGAITATYFVITGGTSPYEPSSIANTFLPGTIMVYSITSITGLMLAALSATILYNVPAMLRTVRDWQTHGHARYPAS